MKRHGSEVPYVLYSQVGLHWLPIIAGSIVFEENILKKSHKTIEDREQRTQKQQSCFVFLCD